MTCPALPILRGAMGKKGNGPPIQPGHSRDKQGRIERTCRHCHSTIR